MRWAVSMLLARVRCRIFAMGNGVNRCFLICKLEFVCRRIVIAVAAAMTRNAVSLACCGHSCTLMRASHCRRGGGRAAHAWFTRSAPPARDEAWGVSMSVTCNRCSALCASCIGLSDRDGAKVHVKASATCVVCTKACSTRTKRLVSRWHARDPSSVRPCCNRALSPGADGGAALKGALRGQDHIATRLR